MTINQETFEAWLFSQPDERTYDYLNLNDCLICKFTKETTNNKNPRATGGGFYPAGSFLSTDMIPYPLWLERFEKDFMTLSTFGAVKLAYIARFGDPFPASDKSKDVPHPRLELTSPHKKAVVESGNNLQFNDEPIKV